MTESNYLEEHGYRAYMDAAEKTLKPCPFCGGKPVYSVGIHLGLDYESGTVTCEDCGANVPVYVYGYGSYDQQRAFDRWNRRERDA